ncbi:MAG: peptidoglycan-binding protein [Acetivibrio sp.]
MPINQVSPVQTAAQSFGGFQVNVTSVGDTKPIPGAKITISITGEPNNKIGQLSTNEVGQTEKIELPAPAIDYSMEPSATQPYSQYTILIEAPGFLSVEVTGSQVFPEVTALQPVHLMPVPENSQKEGESFVIPANRLFGDFPPKIAEDEIKAVNETGEIVLSRVVIPEFIVVHNGPPRDKKAKDYYVRYRDYIKNVASSEIYATWPEASLIANILAIQSFTLNRVYTEWYRNKGYNFTITSSTAYDHKFVPGRNVFANISSTVDTIFSNYLSRPNVKQPILTQYCDGKQVSCPGWMTQWGSKYLADDGFTASEIIKYYYGEDMYINESEEIAGIPSSWPGYDLSEGMSSDKIKQMQNQLNIISKGYPLVPKVLEDGIYGAQTKNSVEVFQGIFGLPKTGVVDFPTWDKISEIYFGVSRIGELR